tara:strand:- start:5446 stop:5637 length:192 start_codon:yes stop_codon:yes gene_type:complete
MQHYKKISKWKDKVGHKCRNCRKVIDEKLDYFELTAHWKIKRKADANSFCSLKCLREWAKDED